MSVDAISDNEEKFDINDGMVANAQGAVSVVHSTSEAVDDKLASIQTAATTQVTEMDAVASDVSSLSATIEEVSASADEVSETTNRAATATTAAREAADEATEAMATASTETERIQEKVATLERKVDQIDEMVDVIAQIAERTNMLALNASIEAARSDDDGQGFAVVAEEVKSLAEESQSRTAEIESASDEIQAVTGEVTDALDQVVNAVEIGAGQVETADAKLEIVTDEVQSAASGISEVSSAIRDGAESASRVADRTEQTTDAAHEIEGAVEDIHEERADMTDLLGEIDTVLTAARETRERRLANGETVPTGIDAFDAGAGGLPAGSRNVLIADSDAETDRVVAAFAASAIDAGWAVSLSPTASLDRGELSRALNQLANVALGDALASNRLFVLDLYGTWNHGENVFDVPTLGLDEANARVDDRRERPLLVIGNIAGELALMGEQAVRENTYENDGDVLDDDDLVCNVIDESTVPDQLTSFYVGAADRHSRLSGTDRR